MISPPQQLPLLFSRFPLTAEVAWLKPPAVRCNLEPKSGEEDAKEKLKV